MSRRKLIFLAALLIGLMPALAVGLGASVALDQQLDKAEKKRVLDAIAASVEKSTFDHDMGLKTAKAIRAQEKSGEYDAAVASEKFGAAEEILERDGWVIPLYRRDTVALVREKWRGFYINPLGQVYLADVY